MQQFDFREEFDTVPKHKKRKLQPEPIRQDLGIFLSKKLTNIDIFIA